VHCSFDCSQFGVVSQGELVSSCSVMTGDVPKFIILPGLKCTSLHSTWEMQYAGKVGVSIC